MRTNRDGSVQVRALIRINAPFRHASVLSVLGNRVYVGEIFFRGTHHSAPHQTLVELDTFEAAQAIRLGRRDEHAKRAANASEYLLAGLVICARCGKRFVGGIANGNRYRYRYYTCFSRARYGKETCAAERLPADALDAAVLNALLATYADRDLFDRALASARDAVSKGRGCHEQELAAVIQELRASEQAIDRYLLAFEAGTLTDKQCSRRLESLSVRTAELCERRATLEASLADVPRHAARLADLDQLRGRV